MPPDVVKTRRKRSPNLAMLVSACSSFLAHAGFIGLMLVGGEAAYQEERSAGIPDQVWGMTASSLGVEVTALHMMESAANPAEHVTELKPLEEPPEEAKPTEAAELIETKEPVEEAQTTELFELEPEVEAEETKPLEADERVDAEEVLEAFEPIAGQSDLEVASVSPKAVEAIEPKEIKAAKTAPPPAPVQEVASIEQVASAGPVGIAAGHGGSRNDTAGQAEISSYSGLVAAHLRRHKRYPTEAERKRINGTVRVAFSVGAKGEVIEARVIASSGSHLLDEEALAMVSRAAPFPSIPPTLGRNSMSFTVPVRFQP